MSMGCISALMRREIFFNKDPLRVRKLLLHRAEINKLFGEDEGAGDHDHAAKGVF